MNAPIAIIDYRAPSEAIQNLRKYFEVFEFHNPHTFEALSGHPDICLFQGQSGLIVAPNTQPELIAVLQKYDIPCTFGTTMIGADVRLSSLYNCVETDANIIHKLGYTDVSIQQICSGKPLLSVPQSYTRCSLLYLGGMQCITSDKGIECQLYAHGYNVMYVSQKGIMLPPYKHGCIAGCFGMYKSTVYCIGSLAYHEQGERMYSFISELGYTIVELYNGPLYDGGGIFIL